MLTSDSVSIPVNSLTKRQRREFVERSAVVPELLDSHQITAALSISYRTLDLWKKNRVIPFFKVGRMVRFDLAAVKQALNERYLVRTADKS